MDAKQTSETNNVEPTLTTDPPLTKTQTWKDVKGFLIALLCALAVATSTGCVQAMNRSVPDMELNGFRFITLFIFTLPFLLITRQGVRIEKGLRFWTFLCALFAVLFNLTRYASVTFISLGQSGSVVGIGTILILTITGRLFFSESVTVVKVGAIIMGCVGILLLYQPGFNLDETNDDIKTPGKQNGSEGMRSHKNDNISSIDFNGSISNNDSAWTDIGTFKSAEKHTNGSGVFLQRYRNDTNFVNHTALSTKDKDTTSGKPKDLFLSTNINVVVLGFTTAALTAIFGSAEIITQKAKLQKLNGLVFCFWFGILGTVTSFLGAVILEDLTLPSSTYDIILMGGHCLAAAFVSISSFYAHKYASFMVVSLAHSTQLFFMFLGQYLILEEVVYGLKLYIEICGAILAMISGSVVPLIQLIQYKRNG